MELGGGVEKDAWRGRSELRHGQWCLLRSSVGPDIFSWGTSKCLLAGSYCILSESNDFGESILAQGLTLLLLCPYLSLF